MHKHTSRSVRKFFFLLQSKVTLLGNGRQVCDASVPHHKRGRESPVPPLTATWSLRWSLRCVRVLRDAYKYASLLAQGRIEKEAKNQWLHPILSTRKWKHKKQEIFRSSCCNLAHSAPTTNHENTARHLILTHSAYTQCSTYYFLSIDLTKHLKISPTNKTTDQKILKIYHAAPLHAARMPNHIPSLPRDYKLHSRQRRQLEWILYEHEHCSSHQEGCHKDKNVEKANETKKGKCVRKPS